MNQGSSAEIDLHGDSGIQLLLKKYRKLFRIPENLNFYTEEDYKTAKKKF
ncbi:hypothetical protein ACFLZM_04470 [Thermodesulfobacteriota bacterium]